MSREKDTEDGDRHDLVEEGAICQSDKFSKDTKGSVEAKWVHEVFAKQSTSTQSLQPVQALGLPEVRNLLIYNLNIYQIIAIRIFPLWLFPLTGDVRRNT